MPGANRNQYFHKLSSILEKGSTMLRESSGANRNGMEINTLLDRFGGFDSYVNRVQFKWGLLKHELLSHMYLTTALSNSTSIIICLLRPPIKLPQNGGVKRGKSQFQIRRTRVRIMAKAKSFPPEVLICEECLASFRAEISTHELLKLESWSVLFVSSHLTVPFS